MFIPRWIRLFATLANLALAALVLWMVRRDAFSASPGAAVVALLVALAVLARPWATPPTPRVPHR